MRTQICLLLIVCLLLAGCRPAVDSANPAASPTAQPTIAPLALEPCTVASSVSAKCGTLRVPEDRANPTGRLLDLAVVVVPARQLEPLPDPLFFLAGGPGGAATGADAVYSARSLFYKINAQRDIVYVDQRGSNTGHELTCDPIPFDISQATQHQMDEWMQPCLSALEGDPRFYTTAEAMRDLDEARAALGYDKINLYGISYGATAAQVYMRMFGGNVRAAVLDHGTALDVPFAQAEPSASQSALEQTLAACEQDDACSGAFPQIRADWQTVLERVSNGPVVTSYTAPGASAPSEVSMDVLANAMHSLLFTSGGHSVIPGLIHQLASLEDWTPVVKSVSEQYGGSSAAGAFELMPNIIMCFEPAWGFDPEEIARANADAYNRDYWVKAARVTQKICAALPRPDPSLIYPPASPAPLSVLMFNSTLDPQNPPSNMEPALKEFTQSRMLVETAVGHETGGSGCRWDLIAQYIEAGTVDGLVTACMENQKPAFAVGP